MAWRLRFLLPGSQMQEQGIPVTYAYVSDAHDGHGTAGNIHFAYGPGEEGYVQQLHEYDLAFQQFFDRLAADGINQSNTLFLFTVDEGDHFVADRTEMKTLHMVTADPLRTPTFTPFADPDWFFFATGGGDCATQADCAFIPGRTSQSFAWNHGDIQDEIASTWAGYVGPGIKHLGDDNSVWTDHTDHRPTLLTLLGLKDDYQTDGRAVTEIANENALPVSLRVHHPSLERLGDSYKQLMASFGSFSMDTL